MSGPAIDAARLERVLVVKLSSLGDIVHALPALRALRAGCPAARIQLVVEARFAALLRHSPHVDELLELPPRARPLRRRLLAWRRLRLRPRFDLALDLQGTRRSAAWVEASRARCKAGLLVAHEPGRRETQRSGWQLLLPRDLSRHAVDECAALVEALGLPCPDRRPELRLDPADEARAEQLLGRYGLSPRGFVALHPFSVWRSKEWPPERYAALIRALAPMPCLLTAGPGEAERLRELRDALHGAPAVVADELPLGVCLGLLRRAALLVAGDTGPLHAAAALGTPLVALYGPTWPERTAPRDARCALLQALRPASHLTYREDPERRHMRAIPVESVAQAARRLWAERGL